MTNGRLIAKLKSIQDKNDYTDVQMASLLRCTRQLYQATKSGRLSVGLTILKGTVKAFPQLTGDAIYFLSDGADIRTALAEKLPTPSQTSQEGSGARFRGWIKGFIGRCRKMWHNSREP